MKKMLVAVLLMLFVASYADEKSKANGNMDLDQLIADQKKIELKMHETRVKLIKDNPEFKALHRKIMAFHKELAIRIGKNKEMADLLKKSKELKAEIKKLTKNKNDKKDFAE